MGKFFRRLFYPRAKGRGIPASEMKKTPKGFDNVIAQRSVGEKIYNKTLSWALRKRFSS